MDTWGVGIFDSDLAQRVRQDFRNAVANGKSVYMATDSIFQNYVSENTMVVTLALAAMQLEHDIIQLRLKKRALTLIISGDAADPWRESGEGALEARQRVLQDLRQRLLQVPS